MKKPIKVRVDRIKLWAICRSLTSSTRAARLLHVVAVFTAIIRPLSHRWGKGFAYTGQEWAARSYHSLGSHNRALSELKVLGLIVVGQGKLGRDKRTWIRLSDVGRTHLFGTAISEPEWVDQQVKPDLIWDDDWEDQGSQGENILSIKADLQRCTKKNSKEGTSSLPSYPPSSLIYSP